MGRIPNGYVDPSSLVTIVEELRKEEVLLGMELHENTLHLRVKSNGNTEEADFDIDVFEAGVKGGQPYRIVIYRMEEDEGTAPIPNGVVLKFPFKDLKTIERLYPKPGDGIIIENLFAVGE
ncbi:MAG: hypothetical protein QNK23_08120 [Crocinitomicaceae bacterium]|nr:hypothetical protein [Crocinitomicaceae bacterium]